MPPALASRFAELSREQGQLIDLEGGCALAASAARVAVRALGLCADPAADIFAMRGIDPDGCIVVVRPDQHVAHVLPLDGHADLAGFFEGFLRPAG